MMLPRDTISEILYNLEAGYSTLGTIQAHMIYAFNSYELIKLRDKVKQLTDEQATVVFDQVTTRVDSGDANGNYLSEEVKVIVKVYVVWRGKLSK